MQELIESAKESLLFLGECLLIFIGIFILAYLGQRFLCRYKPKTTGARRVAFIAMFAAIAGVLMCLELPLFFAPGFYKLDLSELPVLLCSFYLGPVAGVVCEFLKVVIKLLIKGTSTAFVGDFANFVVGCTMILPAALIYHRNKTKKTAIVGMATGTLIMTVFGSAFNAVYLLPTFADMFGMPLDAIVAMGSDVNAGITSVSTLVLFAVVPFNLIKGVVDSVLTFLLYKRLERILFRNKK